jgi:hypothetical protein
MTRDEARRALGQAINWYVNADHYVTDMGYGSAMARAIDALERAAVSEAVGKLADELDLLRALLVSLEQNALSQATVTGRHIVELEATVARQAVALAASKGEAFEEMRVAMGDLCQKLLKDNVARCHSREFSEGMCYALAGAANVAEEKRDTARRVDAKEKP